MNLRGLLHHIERSWRHHFSLQMTTVFVLSLVLIILSFVFSAKQNIARLNEAWGQGLEMTLYLKDSASNADVVTLERELEKTKSFSKVTFVSKDEAAQRFLARMGDLAPDIFGDKDHKNPLPASIDLQLSDSEPIANKVSALHQWASRLIKNPFVSDVSYGQSWIKNWASFLSSIRLLSGLAVLLTLILGLLVIGNSVRVSLSQRHEEVEILELVGATPFWIRAPFIIEGALLGFLSALIGAAISQLLQMALYEYVKKSLSFWHLFASLQPLDGMGILWLIALGTGFGALGAYLCVRNLNSGWAAAERLSQ